jgi:uncharacterized protein
LVFLFFLIAILYASAGLGGGSSYLALMALWGLAPEQIRPTALLCNVVVVGMAIGQFSQIRQVELGRGLRIASISAPFAFLGGMLQLPKGIYFPLLGSGLLLTGVLLFLQKNIQAQQRPLSERIHHIAPVLGACIGFASSMLGIGGGIFLSPLLHFLRWGSPKTIAAAASLFILTNALSALLATFFYGNPGLEPGFVLPLLAAVALGGWLGSRWSAFYFPEQYVRYATALLVTYAGLSLLLAT